MAQKLNDLEKEFLTNSMALGAKQFKEEIRQAAESGRKHIFHENFVDMIVSNICNVLKIESEAKEKIMNNSNTTDNE